MLIYFDWRGLKMGKCCLKSLLGIVLILAIIVIAGVAIINMTPAKLGIADRVIYADQTFTDLGLADTSILDIVKSIQDFGNANKSTIVTNPYLEETDKPKADSNLADSDLGDDGNGNIDYSNILINPVLYDNEYLLTYDDTTIGYIFHSIVTDTAISNEDSLSFLKNIDSDIEEVSIIKGEDSTTLRIVLSIDLASIKAQIKSTLGSYSNYISIPEVVYLVSYSTITADDSGKLVVTPNSLKINDTDNIVSQTIFSILAAKAENTTGTTDTDIINNKIGEAFAIVISNLGSIGTADVDSNNIVIASTKELGNIGIIDHGFTLITNTLENTTSE
jgi:hypothetical protein